MTDLSSLDFPSSRGSIRGRWYPVYIEPIAGSGERLTVGAVAMSDADCYVLDAPGLDRFFCLYDEAGDGVVLAAKVTLDALRSHLERNGPLGLKSFEPPFVSIELGEERAGTGNTLSEIALLGLRASSSLITAKKRLPALIQIAEPTPYSERVEGSETRIVRLVRESVTKARPGLIEAFNRPFRAVPGGRTTRIGFVGQNLVANFGMLRPRRLSESVKDIKTGLWDLSSHRDIETFLRRPSYEMLIHRPSKDDPDLEERHVIRLTEACTELEYEADKKEIRVQPMTSIQQMSERVLEKESSGPRLG
jgi:hypothetical protein